MKEVFLLYTKEVSERRLLGAFTDLKKTLIAANKHFLETEGEEMNRNEYNTLILSSSNKVFEIENHKLNTYLK